MADADAVIVCNVRPLAGAGIEIFTALPKPLRTVVRPLAGAGIEIRWGYHRHADAGSPPRGGGN